MHLVPCVGLMPLQHDRQQVASECTCPASAMNSLKGKPLPVQDASLDQHQLGGQQEHQGGRTPAVSTADVQPRQPASAAHEHPAAVLVDTAATGTAFEPVRRRTGRHRRQQAASAAADPSEPPQHESSSPAASTATALGDSAPSAAVGKPSPGLEEGELLLHPGALMQEQGAHRSAGTDADDSRSMRVQGRAMATRAQAAPHTGRPDLCSSWKRSASLLLWPHCQEVSKHSLQCPLPHYLVVNSSKGHSVACIERMQGAIG